MKSFSIRFILPSLLLALASCSRPSGCCCCGESADSTSTMVLAVPASSYAPRSQASAGSLQVMAFHKGLTVCHVAAPSGSGEVVFEAEGSPLDLLAMVGGPDLSGETTEEGCLSASFTLDACHRCVPQAGLLEDCRPTAVWRGEVEVTPLICRVRVDSVRRSMALAAMRDVPMAVTRVFLANAVSVARLDGAMPAHRGWCNSILASGGAMSVADTFLCRRLSEPLPLADGQSLELGMDFYCCPNDCGSDADTVRATRPVVAIAADVNGDGRFSPEEETFYPLPLGAMRAGGFYEVSCLTVTHLGNPTDGDDAVDPGEDDPVSRSSASFSVTVASWDTVVWGDRELLVF